MGSSGRVGHEHGEERRHTADGAQIAFAIRVRGQSGWHWFLISGCIALVAAVLLVMKLPYTHSFTPATVARVSLLFAGWAYVAMALASRKAKGCNLGRGGRLRPPFPPRRRARRSGG
jgi:hypothetical protein